MFQDVAVRLYLYVFSLLIWPAAIVASHRERTFISLRDLTGAAVARCHVNETASFSRVSERAKLVRVWRSLMNPTFAVI